MIPCGPDRAGANPAAARHERAAVVAVSLLVYLGTMLGGLLFLRIFSGAVLLSNIVPNVRAGLLLRWHRTSMPERCTHS